jgi:hypothetical protein
MAFSRLLRVDLPQCVKVKRLMFHFFSMILHRPGHPWHQTEQRLTHDTQDGQLKIGYNACTHTQLHIYTLEQPVHDRDIVHYTILCRMWSASFRVVLFI